MQTGIEFKDDDIVGVTAGASAPEDIVQEIISSCASPDKIEYLSIINEEEYFPPPSQLRNLAIDFNYAVAGVFACLQESTGSSNINSEPNGPLRSVFGKDRAFKASDSLL